MVEILFYLLLIFLGYLFGSLRVLFKVGKYLEELDVNDPQFWGKIEVISKFNTFLII